MAAGHVEPEGMSWHSLLQRRGERRGRKGLFLWISFVKSLFFTFLYTLGYFCLICLMM
jgi:hypothetical protein